MQSQRILWIGIIAIVIAAAVYYQQHTHTASIELPGGKSVSVTSHD